MTLNAGNEQSKPPTIPLQFSLHRISAKCNKTFVMSGIQIQMSRPLFPGKVSPKYTVLRRFVKLFCLKC